MLAVSPLHFFLLSTLILSGCAFDLAHVSTQPTQFSTLGNSGQTIVLQESVRIDDAPCGYDRTLRKGTKWKLVGKVPEGEVLKPLDQVLTVECSHVFEAYLVVEEDQIVGFYLPVEKTFVPMDEKIWASNSLEWRGTDHEKIYPNYHTHLSWKRTGCLCFWSGISRSKP